MIDIECVILCGKLAWRPLVVLGMTAPLLMTTCPLFAADDPLALGAAQREKLVRLIHSDADAASLFQKLKRQADASLSDPPHPVERLATAGKLASDPAKVQSRTALKDMAKLAAFGYAFAATSNTSYAAAARRLILAWAQTYQPTGSPVDETKLEPLFIAYSLTHASFAPAEKDTVNAWLRRIAREEQAALRSKSATAYNNWNSHRLKILGFIAWLLDDSAAVDEVMRRFKTQIGENLLPDGSSYDFHERDALHYHCFDLEPLLSLAIVAHAHGIALYDYESAQGASLRKSVRFLVPYCEGTATHAEWVHSKVAFDRTRAEAGEAKFEVGSLFEPQDGLRTLELASFFDESLRPLVAKLANRPGARFPTWQSVLNEARRP